LGSSQDSVRSRMQQKRPVNRAFLRLADWFLPPPYEAIPPGTVPDSVPRFPLVSCYRCRHGACQSLACE